MKKRWMKLNIIEIEMDYKQLQRNDQFWRNIIGVQSHLTRKNKGKS